jgi:predicted nucleic acid-binding Zn ribbon protein
MTTPAKDAHDPTGLDLASRIAHAARGGRAVPRRRAPRRDPEETAWSGAGPSARDPQSAGSLLDRVITEKGWAPQLGVASLLGHWADFVGEVNAQHTTPEHFRDGQLTVRAESTTWATAIRTMAPLIVAKLNEQLGQQTVRSIKVLGPQIPSWKKGRRSVPGRGPRDTYG